MAAFLVPANKCQAQEIPAAAGGDKLTTANLPGQEGESIQVTTGPGRYAVDRAYNPDPRLSEREQASGRREAGELPGGGTFSSECHLLALDAFPCLADVGGRMQAAASH